MAELSTESLGVKFSGSGPKRTYVLDACAMIAFLAQEPGSDIVDGLLGDSDIRCIAHAVNLCEVYYDYLRRGSDIDPADAIATLVQAGVNIREDMDTAFWMEVGNLKVNPGKLSLADCFAVALARRTTGTLITTDHAEFDPLVTRKRPVIQFIR